MQFHGEVRKIHEENLNQLLRIEGDNPWKDLLKKRSSHGLSYQTTSEFWIL